MAKEYKVEIVEEGIVGTLLLGASTLPVQRMEEIMNRYGRDGWNMDFMVVEHRRLFLFWSREAAVITFSRSTK
jgi:hypothetical protein